MAARVAPSPLHGHIARAWPSLLITLGLLIAILAGLALPRPHLAEAATGTVATPIAWKAYPANESVEMGDHSLNMNFNFGGPNNVVSSSAHNIRFGEPGTSSGYAVLLRTSSDSTTRKLPPTGAISSRLSSP